MVLTAHAGFGEIKVPPDSRRNPDAGLASPQVRIFVALPAGGEASLFRLPDCNCDFVGWNKSGEGRGAAGRTRAVAAG